MIYRLLVFASWIACALIILSFVMFARDQVSGASKTQVSEVAATVPATVPAHHHQVAQPRRFIDGAAHTLTSPFDNLLPSDSDWVHHGAPALLGLLVYGLGLGYAARFTRGMA